VAEHIAHGDFMGKCTPNCVAPVNNAGLGTVSSTVSAEVSPIVTFGVKAWPNPTENQFTLQVESNSDEKIVVVVYDVLGRAVKYIEKVNGKQVKFGEDLKTGSYFAEIRQGNNRQTIKLIKQ